MIHYVTEKQTLYKIMITNLSVFYNFHIKLIQLIFLFWRHTYILMNQCIIFFFLILCCIDICIPLWWNIFIWSWKINCNFPLFRCQDLKWFSCNIFQQFYLRGYCTDTILLPRCQWYNTKIIFCLEETCEHVSTLARVNANYEWIASCDDAGSRNLYPRSEKHLLATQVQERRNSSALAMELRLSCTNPLIWFLHMWWPAC